MLEWLKQQFESWIERREQRRLCPSCEILKEQLFHANNEKTRLLDQIIELTNPTVTEQTPKEDFKPIKPKMVPWHIRKNMLEAESRAEAKILRDQKAAEDNSASSGGQTFKEVDDLEIEVMKLANEKLVDEAV